jgi:hypothetical protein
MASGSLGTLSIDVLANIANMVSDLSKAQAEAAKASKEMQHSFQEAADSIGDTFKELAATVGLGFGIEKITEFTKSVVEAGLQIYDVSLKTGISAQTLSSYSVAAQEAGVTVEVFANSLSKMARSANDAAHGQEAQVNAFKQLGVSVTDAAGHLKSADQLLDEVSVGLDKLQNGLGKTAIVTEIFGRGGATLIPLLSDLGEGVDAARQKAVAFGLAINDAQAKDLKAFDVTVTDAGLAIRGEFTQAIIQVLPQLQHAADEILHFIEHSQGLKDAINDGAQAIIFLSEHIEQVTTVIKDLAEIMAVRFFLTMAQDALVFGENMLKASASAVTLKTSVTGIVGALAAWDIGTAIGNWLDGFSQVRAAAAALVGATILGWDKMKEGGEIAFAAIATTWNNYVVVPIRSGLASLAESAASFESSIGMQGASAGLQAYAASLRAANSDAKTFAEVKAQIVAASDKEYLSDKEVVQAMIDYNLTAQKAGVTLKSFTVTTNEAKEATDGFAKSSKDGIVALTDEMAKWLAENDALLAKTNPVTAAMDMFDAAMLKSSEELVKMMGNGLSMADALDLLATRTDIETQKMWDSIDADRVKNDKLDALLEKYDEQAQALVDVTNAQKAATAFDKAAIENLDKMHDAYGQVFDEEGNIYTSREQIIAQNAKYRQGWVDSATAVMNHSDAMKLDKEVMQQWASIASNAFDQAFSTINKDIIEGGDVMKDLVNVAKQVVEAIILQFEKLAIINPILNAIFGTSAGNGSLLPTLENSALGQVFGGGSGGGGGMLSSLFGGSGNSLFSSVLGNTGGAGSGIMGFLFGGAGSYNMLAGDGLASMGAADELGLVADYGGEAAGMGEVGGTFGLGAEGTSSGLLSSGGDVGGGAANLGAMAGGALAGWQLGYQLGGTTGGLVGAAGLATAAYFIPVVGWIAGALALVNSLTGGNVFGTKYKPTGVTGTAIDIDSSGASISDWYQEHKHGALFSSGRYKNVGVDATDDQVKAVDAAFDAVQKSINAAAKALGEDSGDVITGSWSQTTDKSGKVIKQTSEVLGKEYTEDSQHFLERIAADSEEALLPVSDALTKFFNQFQSNADQLADAATMLVTAQVDVKKGMGLLGAADTNLGDIGAEVQKLQQGSESLTQTYVRLQTEQQDLSMTLTEMGLSINKTGVDFLEFADSLTAAAGGLQNLNAELSALYVAYTPTGTRGANSFNAAKDATQKALTAIGEDPNESMSQFWADFQAAMPNLTPEQMQQWITAGIDLAQFTNSVTAASQKYADFEIANYGDALVSAYAGVVEWENQQIDAANQLAIASGHAGASQLDLANIMRQGTAQMGKAIADLTQGITGDISSLNGLTFSTGDPTLNKIAQIQAGIGGTGYAQQQAHAQQVSTTYDLIQKLGDFSFGTGEDVDQVLKAFGLSPGAIGKILGENADQVRDQIKAAADQDAAMVNLVAVNQETNDILRDILDVTQGKDPTVDLTKYLSPPVDDGKSTKPGVGTGTLPPGSYPSTTTSATNSNTAALTRNTSATTAHTQALLNQRRYTPTPRNTRSIA